MNSNASTSFLGSALKTVPSPLPPPRPANGRRCFGITLAVALAALLVDGIVPLENSLAHLGYDLPFAFRRAQHSNEVLLVLADHEAHAALQQNPGQEWNRHLHAQLLTNLLAAGVKGVVFDVWFAETSSVPGADEELARALAAARERAVHAGWIKSIQYPGGLRLERLKPAARFQAAAPWGYAVLAGERNVSCRKLWESVEDPALFQVAAENFGGPTNTSATDRWFNYYGSRAGPFRVTSHGFAALSYHEALTNAVSSPATFRDKIVFIGGGSVPTSQGPQSNDEHVTPITRWTGHKALGIEIQATAFLNVWRGESLRRLPAAAAYAFYLVAALVLGLGLARLRPLLALGVGAVSFLVLAATAFAMVWIWHVWFAWPMIGMVQIPVAIALLGLTHRPQVETQRARGERADSGSEKILLVPDYEMIRPIGKGGFGEVWLARNATGAYHAVKIVRRSAFGENECAFGREFAGLQKFYPLSRSHPGWVDVLHVGRNLDEGYFYYVMELGDDVTAGQLFDPPTYRPRTLSSDLQACPAQPLPTCLDLGLALADALAHLHSQQLIHRDIKPANVIFVHGTPKFADIGLVTDVANTGRSVTQIGTHGFMPPEGPGSITADIYGLGMLLYEMVTGRGARTFAPTHTALEDRPDGRQARALFAVILKACSLMPEDRYQTARELHAAIEACRAGLPITPSQNP